MSKTPALVFPGQGSQNVGMLDSLGQVYPLVKQTIDEASSVLGYDLWQVMTEDSDNRINNTEVTQPVLLTAGVAIWRLLQDELVVTRPSFMAGHSLGEYTALVCAEAIAFDDALRLVEQRGKLMQSAVPVGEGAMAAIVGLDDKTVQTVCAQIEPRGSVTPANFNAPGQVVIAGAKEAVETACGQLKEAGARMVKMLAMSVPSHCPLMRSAADELAEALAHIDIVMPKVTVLHNVDASPAKTPKEIRKKLVAQLYSPVRWVDTIRRIADEGINLVYELGPGRVLAGLNKRIDKEVSTYPIYDVDSINKVIDLDLD